MARRMHRWSACTPSAGPRRSVTRSREGLPAQHHGRGGGPFTLVTRQADMLAHTDFGADVPELLREAGFEAETYFDGVESVFGGLVRDG